MRRGSGETSRQMKAAPKNAVFIWCGEHTEYPKSLAVSLGRPDLRIEGPIWLERGMWYGLKLSGIVLDHAANLSNAQWYGYFSVLTRVRG